jgi:hypothetical protein
MDTIYLRKLARKSIVNFGIYNGITVQMFIDQEYHWKLVYAYYRYTAISFLDEILDELKITEEFRIEKPGSNLEMFEKWKNKQRLERSNQ